jgi:hypothetical protein
LEVGRRNVIRMEGMPLTLRSKMSRRSVNDP